MVRPGRLADLGGGYISFSIKPIAGFTGANVTMRVPTNVPPLGELIQLAGQVFVGTAGSFNLTQYGIVKKTATPGAAKACLVDFRTVRLGSAHTGANKNLISVIAKLAPQGYSGAQDAKA